MRIDTLKTKASVNSNSEAYDTNSTYRSAEKDTQGFESKKVSIMERSEYSLVRSKKG